MAPRIILDFPTTAGIPGRRLFRSPQRVVSTNAHSEIPSLLREIEADCEAGATAVGFLSYESAPAFDAAFETHAPDRVPLLWFALFEQEYAAPDIASGQIPPLNWQPEITPADHADAVTRIREEIAAGTTYQVNFTTRLRSTFAGDALALYESLRPAQGIGYHAFIETDDWCVLSLSPELFFEVEGRTVRTKPMKGTRGRGRFTAEDHKLADELRDSAKERAENLMIVDLMRNDIGRVAEAGSVHVTRLYDVERYPTVHQLTSTIEAELRGDTGLAEIMHAVFPPGSVTGAPKISTMKLIRELERSPRGIYCGAIGVVESGRSTFNVPIRTIFLNRKSGAAEYGSGGGITADSIADHEYEELLTKALVVSQPWPRFDLLETMRVDNGVIPRLHRHLARLQDSADYFGFGYDHDAVMSCIADAHGRAHARARLLLDERGQPRLELLDLDELPETLRVTLARGAVSSRNRFLFHKTTHRGVYERHRESAPEYFDVLLWNERDEITEFTRGNVVVEIDGARYTPPRECGLLAGVMRSELLDKGDVAERIIGRTELAHASRIWFVNSVRGCVEVELVN